MAPQSADPAAVVQRSFFIYREPLVRYARRRVGSAYAEDIASEVLVRALCGASSLRSADSKPWLFGIAQNVIAEHRRAERRQWQLLEKLASQRGLAVQTESFQQLQPQFVNALARLPSIQREALLLVVWGELSYEECAVALSVPVGTVRSRISRARSVLQEVCDPHKEEIR